MIKRNNSIFRRSLLLTLALLLAGSLFTGCNPEQDVDLDLPEYANELAVECYLEPGHPYELLLTESVPYFGEFDGIEDILPALITDALVVITHDGVSDTLEFDPTDILDLANDSIPFNNWFNGRKKVHNFKSASLVPLDYDSDFTLYILDSEGRELTGTTRLLTPVHQDTLEIEFNAAGTEALVRGRWQDDPSQRNWYRWSQQRIRRSGRLAYRLNLVVDDRLGNGEEFIVSSFYEHEPGDCLLVSLFHIEQEFADYMDAVDDAEDSNGNPFAQPGSILSNVEGGIGIFTALSITTDTIQIP